MKIKDSKLVIFAGQTMLIGKEYNFLAVDANGEVWAYTEKPSHQGDLSIWISEGVGLLLPLSVDLEDTDWKETLQEI